MSSWGSPPLSDRVQQELRLYPAIWDPRRGHRIRCDPPRFLATWHHSVQHTMWGFSEQLNSTTDTAACLNVTHGHMRADSLYVWDPFPPLSLLDAVNLTLLGAAPLQQTTTAAFHGRERTCIIAWQGAARLLRRKGGVMAPGRTRLKQKLASLPGFRNLTGGRREKQWTVEEEHVDLQVGRTCWSGVQRKMRTELW